MKINKKLSLASMDLNKLNKLKEFLLENKDFSNTDNCHFNFVKNDDNQLTHDNVIKVLEDKKYKTIRIMDKIKSNIYYDTKDGYLSNNNQSLSIVSNSNHYYRNGRFLLKHSELSFWEDIITIYTDKNLAVSTFDIINNIHYFSDVLKLGIEISNQKIFKSYNYIKKILFRKDFLNLEIILINTFCENLINKQESMLNILQFSLPINTLENQILVIESIMNELDNSYSLDPNFKEYQYNLRPRKTN